MNTTTETLDLATLHVTREIADFDRPEIAALYFDPEPDFREIEQDVLVSLIEANLRQPFRYSDTTQLEFQPDDVFMEQTFTTISTAMSFVREVLDELGLLEWSRCVDIMRRLAMFSRLNQTQHLRCRFEILSGDSCSRFHVDAVRSRLICTYAGPGTQLKLPESTDVLQLPAGTGLIVKGSGYPGYEPVTLHRSPPIAGCDVRRFLFVVDDARESAHQH